MSVRAALPLFADLSPGRQQACWEEALARLESLIGGDPGFFVLAVHSLVEAWMNAQVYEWHMDGGPEYREERDKSFFLKADSLTDRNPGQSWSRVLQGFKTTYGKTNCIRHHFSPATHDMVLSAGYGIATFSRQLRLAGEERLRSFEARLDKWKDGHPVVELIRKLAALEHKALQALDRNKTLEASLADLNRLQVRLATAENELAQKQHDFLQLSQEAENLGQTREKLEASREKEKRARQEVYELGKEVRKLSESAREHEHLRRYLEELQRLHHASKTLQDYQRTLMRLSQEQEEVLGSFKPGEDFLVRGGAGTGKTLVLIKAIQLLRREEAGQLYPADRSRVLMLAFTKTLVRYGRYLGSLVASGQTADEIQNIDTWMLKIASELLGHEVKVHFDRKSLVASGLDLPDKPVWDEIEDFIWAKGLDKADYLDRMIPRTGRKNALGREQRSAAWTQAEKALAAMETKGIFSKAGLRVAVLKALEGKVPKPVADVIAVDEVQDILPVELRIIKKLAARSVIMAGDTQQSLHQAGFSFASAGLDIAGRSRVLKRNYRNTRQIEQLAAAFMESCGSLIKERTETTALRDGIPPRLCTYKNAEDAPTVLARCLEYYRDILGYSQESIAILYSSPREETKDKLEAAIKSCGMTGLDIHDRERWMDESGVRISTIHSAKGLDFPVVILYLPKMATDRTSLEDEARYAVEASLVYVGLTRALEHVSVVLSEKTTSTILTGLIGAFGKTAEG